MGHGAWGISHWALGIGHWSLVISHQSGGRWKMEAWPTNKVRDLTDKF
ncbi:MULTISPECIES: hypothetical protein [unclassified Microcoleus]